MRRKLIVLLVLLVGCISLASTALAAPNPERANCQAILTSFDAQIQERDDLAREFAGFDFPPGAIYSHVSTTATGTTPEECLASVELP